ncbi:MAG: insulinase family protein, partial [Alphaproteobacteria bacterium]|nr:insulinase family protein [Alphaproteobacteria bacterium]
YGHTTIGSMADLDHASLEDVRAWFREHYGPNNAVLVLSGDIDLATARAKAERWFGSIKGAPAVIHPQAPIPTLPAPKLITLTDRVATTRVSRFWTVPGVTTADNVDLDLAASILGGLASSRFDNILVREKQVAVGDVASLETHEKLGFFEIHVDVKPGVDAAVAGKAMDEIVDDFLKNGPTPSEVQRAQMQMVGDKIKALESVSGQSAELASGALYHDNPGYVLTRLHAVATATPEEIRKAAAKWLSRPALTIIINPGPRPPYTEAAPAKINPAADTPIPPTPGTEDRNTPPPVEALAKMTFPAIERTTLNNGIPVYFARRNAIPVVNIDLDFDAGYAADSTDAIGTQGFML